MAATLAFVGDIMLGRMVDAQIGLRPPESFWGSALSVLRRAAAVFGNLECAVSDRGVAHGRVRKAFAFRARPAAVDVLRAGGIRWVSLANNHVLDYGDEALLDTLRHLDDAGIAHAGAGPTLAAAVAPAVVVVESLRVGVVAITDNEPDFAAGASRAGTHYVPIAPTRPVLDALGGQVDRLRRRGAAPIVLSAHWGPNMVETPPVAFRRFARAAIDLGVDILHGHSAHVFQGVEAHAGGVILYDTGDFLDDYAVDPALRNDWSFIFLVDVDAGKPTRLRMVPVRLRPARVDLAAGAEAAAIESRMIARCAALGVRPRRTGEGLELPLGADAGGDRPCPSAWAAGRGPR